MIYCIFSTILYNENMKEIKTKNNYNFFLIFSFLFLFLLSGFFGFYNFKIRRIKDEFISVTTNKSLKDGDESPDCGTHTQFFVNQQYETTHFIFKYKDDSGIQPLLTSFENTIEDAYDFFYQSGNGLNLPIKRVEDEKYTVYLTNLSDVNSAGFTYPVDTNFLGQAPFASYIVIYNVGVGVLNFNLETLVHEYFHAIQFTYTAKQNFFTEACANLAKILITGYCNSAAVNIKNFISSLFPLYALDTQYGAVLFPYILYNQYGGLNTIKALYERFSIHPTADGVMLESDFIDDINTVLNSYNSNNGSNFNDIFVYLSAYCSYPNKFFNSILSQPYLNNLTNTNITNNTVILTNDSNSDSFSFNILRKGRYYKKFILNTHSLVFNISATYSSNDIVLLIVKETKTGQIVSDFLINFSNNFNFYVDTSIYDSIVFNVINLNDYYSGSYSVNINTNHLHHYDSSYEFYNNSKHYSYCDCGDFILGNHAIYQNSILTIGNKQFAPCIYCNEMLDLSRCIAEIII